MPFLFFPWRMLALEAAYQMCCKRNLLWFIEPINSVALTITVGLWTADSNLPVCSLFNRIDASLYTVLQSCLLVAAVTYIIYEAMRATKVTARHFRLRAMAWKGTIASKVTLTVGWAIAGRWTRHTRGSIQGFWQQPNHSHPKDRHSLLW